MIVSSSDLSTRTAPTSTNVVPSNDVNISAFACKDPSLSDEVSSLLKSSSESGFGNNDGGVVPSALGVKLPPPPVVSVRVARGQKKAKLEWKMKQEKETKESTLIEMKDNVAKIAKSSSELVDYLKNKAKYKKADRVYIQSKRKISLLKMKYSCVKDVDSDEAAGIRARIAELSNESIMLIDLDNGNNESGERCTNDENKYVNLEDDPMAHSDEQQLM
jgi:hypothetical protein